MRVMYDDAIIQQKAATEQGEEISIVPEKEKLYQEAESFLNATWSQIPDRTSRFRIMKPRIVESGGEIRQRIRAIYVCVPIPAPLPREALFEFVQS